MGSSVTPISATMPLEMPIALPDAGGPVDASMSPAQMLLNSAAGKQLISGILQNANAGMKQGLDQMSKWGEPDEDDPDPDEEPGI
jgi:hypothetical protein